MDMKGDCHIFTMVKSWKPEHHKKKMAKQIRLIPMIEYKAVLKWLFIWNF